MEYPSNNTPLDSFLKDVELAERTYRAFAVTGIVLDDCQAIKIELQFLKTFYKCMIRNQHLEDPSESTIAAILCEPYDLLSQSKDLLTKLTNLQWAVSGALWKIGETRQNIRHLYEQMSASSESYTSMTEDLVVELIDDLMENLKYLVSSEANLEVTLKRQIEVLKKELRFLRNFIVLAAKRCIEHDRFKDLLAHTEALAIDAARLSYSCFSKEKNEESSLAMKPELSDLLQRLKPANVDVREMYITVLSASKLSRYSNTCLKDTHIIGAFVDSLRDILFEILNSKTRYKHPLQDQLIKLDEELRFQISLLTKPLEGYIDSENLNDLLGYTDATIIDSARLILFLHAHEFIGDIAIEKNLLLVDLLERMKYIKEEAKKIYLKVPKSLPSTFSRTYGLGFIKYFLENLKAMCHFGNSIALPRYHIDTVQKDFEFLSSLLSNMEKQLDQQEELKWLWTRVIEIVSHAEYVIDLSGIEGSPMWYYMLWLDDLLEEIQLVKANATKIFEGMQCETRTHALMKSSIGVLSKANSHTHDERVVGFDDEAEKVMQLLIRGSGAKLDVVSIVGMPGSGKTTLSKKVYNSEVVAKHFHVRAWCCVSQVYRKRHLFLSVLSYVAMLNDDETDRMDEDKLAEALYKSLKGRRYLIVMDDIWDIQVWHDFRVLFPDDQNGSRIMFTSRLLDVSLQAKLHSNPHFLRPLKDDECWELLQHLLFLKKKCPLELRDIGKKIAKGCKGVPLSVVLVSGLLMTKQTEDSWNEVAQSLTSRLIDDPQSHCMDIIGMSYNDLPDQLKRCFLYFGVFLEDEEISVKHLISLWSAEGFVREVEGRSIDVIAEDYLKDLICRNLVNVSRWKANGGIKKCRLHDLLYYFCQAKNKEENFGQLIDVLHETRTVYMYGFGKLDPDLCRLSENSVSVSPVRSIFISERTNDYFGGEISSISDTFKLLRVLDLLRIRLNNYPPGLELLIHLKYLGVRAGVSSVPESISNLLFLETLLLDSPFRVSLPAIWKSKKLRYIYTSGTVMLLSDRRNQVLSPRRCLPKVWCHDRVRQTSFKESDKLCSLEEISNLSLLPGEEEEIFRKIPNIRALGCILEGSLENEYGFLTESSRIPAHIPCSHFPKLDLLNKLEILDLDCNIHCSRHVMNKKMKKKHSWNFSFPSSLKELALRRCHLKWTEISIIGRLGNLEVLRLVNLNFEGQRWDMINGEFPKLRHLQLVGVDLKDWDASADHFPHLQRLKLKSCHQLKEIPSCLGAVATLEMIKVKWCSELDLELVRQIQQEQVDMANDEFKVLIETEPESISNILSDDSDEN